MGTQRIPRRGTHSRAPGKQSNRDLQKRQAVRRHASRRNAGREVRRIGARHTIELEVLAAAATPTNPDREDT